MKLKFSTRPNDKLAISATSSNVIADWTCSNRIYTIFMSPKDYLILAGFCVPDPCTIVLGSRNNPARVGSEGDCKDRFLEQQDQHYSMTLARFFLTL